MASEDSDEFVSGLSPVHGLRDLHDLQKTVDRLVTTAWDELYALRELLEVLLLRAAHRMLSEERDDRLRQILTATHYVAIKVLAMVVVPLVREYLSDAKELTEIVETTNALSALSNRELVSNLVTEPVADSFRPILLPNEADGEASFSVYKADHPATELDQPFLLVFRTRHVVTTVNAPSDVTR
jgi:hypothetical protein